MDDRNLVNHCLNRGLLVASAVRHQHRTSADGGVKTLRQTSLGAYVQVGRQFLHSFVELCRNLLLKLLRVFDDRIGLLLRTVGIQECSGNVYDFLALEVHHQGRLFRYFCHNGRFQVFGNCQFLECFHILCRNNDRHSLLRFTDRKLGSVQSIVLLRYVVQRHAKSVCQLSDGNGYTAGTEVVAALNQCGCRRVAEQSLNLPLLRCITLLNLCAAAFQGFFAVGFGRSGGSADSVSSGPSAQQDNLISRSRTLSSNILCRCRTNDCADFHSLCHITRMINLIHQSGGQTNLVAVGAVSVGGGGHDLTLRQLALYGFCSRCQRISRTGHTHCRIYIASAGQRVTDGTADAGCCAAERLDFGWVVVGLVLKEQHPILFLSVDVRFEVHGAGIDFFRLYHVGQPSVLLQGFHGDGCHVHQGYRLGDIQILPCVHVFLEGLAHRRVLELHVVKGGIKCGMPAVIRPIGIDNANLRYGWISVLTLEVIPYHLQIFQIHSQAIGLQEVFQLTVVLLDEAV